jgi:sugar/nucleoside kinase (ribokinase family)
MTTRPFDVLVAGEINPDLILSGDVEPRFGQVEKLVEKASLTVGSSSVIFACGAARLGLRVAFVGVCGEDLFGRFMLREMQQRQIDVGNVIVRQDGQTGLSVTLDRQQDRAILTFPGLIAALRDSDIPDSVLTQAQHLHISSYFLQTALQPDLPALLARAHRAGLTTSLDPNYDPSGLWPSLDELFPHTDVLLLNEKEALCLSGESDVDAAAQVLGRKVQVLGIKLGAAGALGMRSDQRVRVPSIPVEVVDTVGAGDSFDAGFVYGFLRDWNLTRCLSLACVCGALSARRPGGTAGQPDLAEALRYVPG